MKEICFVSIISFQRILTIGLYQKFFYCLLSMQLKQNKREIKISLNMLEVSIYSGLTSAIMSELSRDWCFI